jgi:hypothetical protein
MADAALLIGLILTRHTGFLTGKYTFTNSTIWHRVKCALIILCGAILFMLLLVMPYFDFTLLKYLWQALGFFLAAISVIIISPAILEHLKWIEF